MAKCPYFRKPCLEHDCELYMDIPTKDGIEWMCFERAAVRLQMAQIEESRGVHAAVNSNRNEVVKVIAPVGQAIKAAIRKVNEERSNALDKRNDATPALSAAEVGSAGR